MLEEKDLKAIAELINERATKTEEVIVETFVKECEILEKRIEKVEKNLEELNQYYIITKLENDNTALLLKMIEELQKRVAELERKTA